jgi:hypothetical protein
VPHLRDSVVKGKKEYRCAMCDEKILAGERHVVRVGVWDDFGQFRMHLECEYETRNWSQDEWDSHEPCEFKRPTGMTALVACGKITLSDALREARP